MITSYTSKRNEALSLFWSLLGMSCLNIWNLDDNSKRYQVWELKEK